MHHIVSFVSDQCNKRQIPVHLRRHPARNRTIHSREPKHVLEHGGVQRQHTHMHTKEELVGRQHDVSIRKPKGVVRFRDDRRRRGASFVVTVVRAHVHVPSYSRAERWCAPCSGERNVLDDAPTSRFVRNLTSR